MLRSSISIFSFVIIKICICKNLTPSYKIIKINELRKIKYKNPFVIKPINEGSSKGVYVILNESGMNNLIDIKIIIHEQNIILGRANKLLIKLADIISLGFENTVGV